MAGTEPKKRSFNNITVIIPSTSLFLLAPTWPKLSKDLHPFSVPAALLHPTALLPVSLSLSTNVLFLYTHTHTHTPLISTRIVRSKGLLDFERPYVESWLKHFYFSAAPPGLFWNRVVERIVSKLGRMYVWTGCV